MPSLKDHFSGIQYFLIIVAIIIFTGIGAHLLYPYFPWIFDNPENVKMPKGNISVLSDGRVAPLTPLSEEEMVIQKNYGCLACHGN